MSPKLQVFSIYPRKSHTRFCCLSGTRILEEGPASKRRAFVGCQQDPRSRAGLAIVSTKSTCLPRKSKYALQTDCKPSHCVMIRQTLGIISQYMRLVAALRPGDSPTIVLLYAKRFADADSPKITSSFAFGTSSSRKQLQKFDVESQKPHHHKENLTL